MMVVVVHIHIQERMTSERRMIMERITSYKARINIYMYIYLIKNR